MELEQTTFDYDSLDLKTAKFLKDKEAAIKQRMVNLSRDLWELKKLRAAHQAQELIEAHKQIEARDRAIQAHENRVAELEEALSNMKSKLPTSDIKTEIKRLQDTELESFNHPHLLS